MTTRILRMMLSASVIVGLALTTLFVANPGTAAAQAPECPAGYALASDGTCTMFVAADQEPSTCPDGSRGVPDACYILVATGPATCAFGTLVGGLCEIIGNPPTPGPAVCPTSAIVFFDGASCFSILTPNPDGSCPAAADLGLVNGQCRQNVELVPGGLTCDPGFGLVFGECIRFEQPTFQCPAGSVLDADGNCRKPVASVPGAYSCADPAATLLGMTCISQAPFANLFCDDLPVTILWNATSVATPGDDVIQGSANADTINARSGDDTICADAGNDTIRGGPGNDTILAEDGDDTVNGGSGVDEIVGGSGADDVRGGPGDDYITGDAGEDLVRGDSGFDELYGEADNDVIRGGPDDDAIFGGDGDDFLTGSTGWDTIHGDAGDDDIYGQIGADTLNGGIGNDWLRGGSDGDILNGDGGTDRLDGNGGDDEMYGGIGNDDLNGMDGNDFLSGDDGNDNLSGGNGDDFMTGGAGNNDICRGNLGYDFGDGSCETLSAEEFDIE